MSHKVVSCNTYRYGNYHLFVADSDAMDTTDSEPAVTLDNILVPATNTNPSVNPSLLPGATNLPTGTSLGSSNDSINGNSVYIYSLHCGRSVYWMCNNAFTNNSRRCRYMHMKWAAYLCPLYKRRSPTCTGDCGGHIVIIVVVVKKRKYNAKLLLLYYFTVKMSIFCSRQQIAMVSCWIGRSLKWLPITRSHS